MSPVSSTSTSPRPAASLATGKRLGCRRTLGLLEGQAHDRAALGPGLSDHGAVLRDGQPPDNVEPDAHAAEPAAVARLALHEALEDPFVIAGGDANALVFDVHLDQRPDRA